MKKSGLHDMKLRNRQVVLQAVLESGGLSRIEIAQRTELSPSTVTGLVGDLLEQKVLVETGVTTSTAGRRRVEVSVNPDYGSIAVAEIGRRGATLYLFNMLLEQTASVTIADSYLSGNDLLVAITAAIFETLGADRVRSHGLSGIGLLFQEDMTASEFNVIYSTSLSSASITLRDALVTQFRTTVVEEYSRTYSLTDACVPHSSTHRVNSLHLALGSTVRAAMVIDGKALPLREGQFTDITPLLGGLPTALPPEEGARGEKALPTRTVQEWTEACARQLSGIMAVLCTLFPLDVVYLSGIQERCGGLAPRLYELLAQHMKPVPPPQVRLFDPDTGSGASLLATKMRTDLLFAK